MKGIAVLLALGSACVSAATGLPASPAPLCTGQEQVYFSCKTSNGRWISLCGASPQTLHYRFGKPGAIELLYPGPENESRSPFLFAHYTRYRTERREVSFRNGNADYAVFDYSEFRKRRAGIRVTTEAGQEKEFRCAGKVTSQLQELEGKLPCDADNALNGGGCP
jgi:hypothetical protein